MTRIYLRSRLLPSPVCVSGQHPLRKPIKSNAITSSSFYPLPQRHTGKTQMLHARESHRSSRPASVGSSASDSIAGPTSGGRPIEWRGERRAVRMSEGLVCLCSASGGRKVLQAPPTPFAARLLRPSSACCPRVPRGSTSTADVAYVSNLVWRGSGPRTAKTGMAVLLLDARRVLPKTVSHWGRLSRVGW
jgi:hypothetical protein